MNIVFAKHSNQAKVFCFSVPDCMVPHIANGTDVLVDTARGKSMATTTTGVISGAGAVDLARQNGATEPLRSVLSFVDPMIRAHVNADALKLIQQALTPPPPTNDSDWLF